MVAGHAVAPETYQDEVLLSASSRFSPADDGKNIYQLCFVLLSIALASSLVVEALPRKIFYFSSYLVALYLVILAVKNSG